MNEESKNKTKQKMESLNDEESEWWDRETHTHARKNVSLTLESKMVIANYMHWKCAKGLPH